MFAGLPCNRLLNKLGSTLHRVMRNVEPVMVLLSSVVVACPISA